MCLFFGIGLALSTLVLTVLGIFGILLPLKALGRSICTVAGFLREGQTEATINGMKMGIGLLPAIVIAVACAVMAFYSLTDDRFSEIVAELRARRADGK